jgi:hypothetical protein
MFDMHHVLADHGGRHIETICGGDEAARLDHLAEYSDARQRVHANSLNRGCFNPKSKKTWDCQEASKL